MSPIMPSTAPWIRRAATAAILLAIGALPALAQDMRVGAVLTGTPSITDGDTLRIGDARIRLQGIDAPETDQHCKDGRRFVPCGAFATRALTDLVGNAPVSCTVHDIDRYDRAVAVCQSSTGTDLNGAMAFEGWAIAMPRYSQAYIPHAHQARAAGRGLWGMDFHAPGDWRRGARW